jgi:hypothetical protein
MDGLVVLQRVLEKLPMEQAQPAAQSVISHFQLDPSSVVHTLVDEFYLASTALARSKGTRGQTRPLMPAPWLGRSFSDYVALAKPLETLVGNEAERRLEGESEMDDAVQVDLFLLAYFSYFAQQDMELVHLLLMSLRHHVFRYEKQGKVHLLGRLLRGIGHYRELSYIFQLLFDSKVPEAFNTVLLCQRVDLSDEAYSEFGRELGYVLHKLHPQDDSRLVRVYVHFGMHRELGVLKLEKAKQSLEQLLDHVKSQSRAAASAVPGALEVLPIMSKLLDAARSLQDAKCWSLASSAMAMISLLGLQVQIPATRVLQLDEQEVQGMLASMDWGFRVSYVLANAYQLHGAGLWTKALHSQVIVQGNFDFMEEFLDMLVMPPLLFEDIHSLFIQTGQSSASQRKHYRKFLSYLPDLNMRARLANEVAHAMQCRRMCRLHAWLVVLVAGGRAFGHCSRLLSERNPIRLRPPLNLMLGRSAVRIRIVCVLSDSVLPLFTAL